MRENKRKLIRCSDMHVGIYRLVWVSIYIRDCITELEYVDKAEKTKQYTYIDN